MFLPSLPLCDFWQPHTFKVFLKMFLVFFIVFSSLIQFLSASHLFIMDQNPGKSTKSVTSVVNVVDIVKVDVTSDSIHQRSTPTIHRTRRSFRRRQNILEAQCLGSVQDVVEETESEAPSLTNYQAYNVLTKFKTQREIDELASKYCIPINQLVCYLLTSADRACNAS